MGCPPTTSRDGGLLDVNPNSVSFNRYILPENFQGQISAWYFGHATWSYCSVQFGHLDRMQKDFDADYPEAGIFILGVNEIGYGGNSSIYEGRDLPWLLDTYEANWWGQWSVTLRDVVILDRDGDETDVFNLTEHNLDNPDEYEALKTLLLDSAEN